MYYYVFRVTWKFNFQNSSYPKGVKEMPKTGEVKEVFLERKIYKVHSPSIFENTILGRMREFRTKREAVKYAKEMSNLFPKLHWVVSHYHEREEAVYRTAIKDGN